MTARLATTERVTRRRLLRTLTAAIGFVTVAGLAACGRKSTPVFPAGTTFPRQFPIVENQAIPGKRGTITDPNESRPVLDTELNLDNITDTQR